MGNQGSFLNQDQYTPVLFNVSECFQIGNVGVPLNKDRIGDFANSTPKGSQIRLENNRVKNQLALTVQNTASQP